MISKNIKPTTTMRRFYFSSTLNNVHRLSLNVSMEENGYPLHPLDEETEETVFSYGALFSPFRWGGFF